MAFSEIIGHRVNIKLISIAVSRKSLPPSLLFVGPKGVGKRLVAIALSQALNCLSPIFVKSKKPKIGTDSTVEYDACDQCVTCKKISRGSHPDVMVIEPTENDSIVIDSVRESIRQTAYRPFEGKRRVVIIDEADRLVLQAQNALLKILEEPPNSSQFILVTARVDTLLATVRSRCQRLNFSQLTPSQISDLLINKHGYSANEAWASTALAGGSIGQALLLTSGELTILREEAVKFLSAIAASPNTKSCLDGAKQWLIGEGKTSGKSGTLRKELIQRLGILSSLLRDLELVANGGDQSSLVNIDLKEQLLPLAERFGGNRGIEGFSIINEALQATERNANPRVVSDWVSCRL